LLSRGKKGERDYYAGERREGERESTKLGKGRERGTDYAAGERRERGSLRRRLSISLLLRKGERYKETERK
jgi:hypothetical protein